ncbi:transglycosylase SLT domain-containing protein [Burkholderia vietnamiensis]|uniref:transglycosylase SLT domain-containing protein n=1 Tax=Burkholderia vietnamiensis TaxID=60552 RepID=UPI001B930456|nr:transglycosylase SLT domain-containing protein [Burkholderia vietnamiensis]MBR8188794.1 transglycosylase SLT domain-containing protein [Burkholderia vietnamiensis]
MTSTQIKFSADASAVEAALDAVNKKVGEVDKTLNAGTVGIDTTAAEKQLDGLEHKAGDLFDSLDTGSVTIDTKAAEKQLDELVNKVDDLAKATKEAASAGADLDFDAVAKSAEEAAKSAEALGKAIDQQGSGKASGIQQKVAELNNLRETIERVRKVQSVLAKEGIQLSRRQVLEAKKRYDEWRKSGAQGTGKIRNVELDDFVDGGWRKMALAEIDARRFRRNVLTASGIDTAVPVSPGAQQQAAPAPRQPAREPREKTPAQVRTLAKFAASAVRDALGGVVDTAMPGGGGIGGRIAGRGVTAAAASEGGLLSMGGLGRMAAGLGIGALAFGAVKAIGAVKEKVGDAEDESTAYTDLRHALGQTRTDFDLLRASLRDSVKGLGVTNNEVVALGSQFARIAGSAPGQERELGADVRTSIAFSRSYGLDPSQGVGLFATARHFGVTQNDSQNRRLAMMIGDAVGSADSFARMPDMIAAVEGFTERAGRSTLGSAPNMEGFLDEMAKLAGLHMTGLDTKGANSIIGGITSAWHAGGGAGEASQNFRMRMFTNALPGFTAFDLGAINDADPFSTVEQVFGKKSPFYRLAESRGDKARLAQLDGYTKAAGNRTLLDTEATGIFTEYGKDTGMLESVLARQYGLSTGQAASWALSLSQGKQIGMTESTLTHLGIDPRSMHADYSALAQLNYANPDQLKETARNYLKDTSLSPKLRETLKYRLNGATDDAGNETLRRSLMQIAAMVGTPKDEGQSVRDAVTDLKNVTQDMAAHLVPYTNDIREGILSLAQYFGGNSLVKGIEAREFTKPQRDIHDQYDAAVKARDAAAAAVSEGPKAAVDALDKQIADFEREHTDRNTHTLNMTGAQRAQYNQLKARRAEAAGGDYSAKLQKDLDDKTKHLADVRERAAKMDDPDASIQYKDWIKRIANGSDDSRTDAQDRLSDHLGQMAGTDGRLTTAFGDSRAAQVGKSAALNESQLGAIEEAAKRHGIPPDLLYTALNLEKSGPNAVSPKGALGEFQIMPDNAKGTGLDPTKFADGAELAARVFADGAKRYGTNRSALLAYYNGGTAQGDAVAKGRQPGSDETRRYLLADAAENVKPAEKRLPDTAARDNKSFGDMPLPPSSATAQGPNGAMMGTMQRYLFEHKITVVDQHGKPRAAPVFTTVQADPTPSGVRS